MTFQAIEERIYYSVNHSRVTELLRGRYQSATNIRVFFFLKEQYPPATCILLINYPTRDEVRNLPRSLREGKPCPCLELFRLHVPSEKLSHFIFIQENLIR